MTVRSVLALPVFPGRCQPSIVGRSELNYRVRNGNGWTLALISTNFVDTNCALLTSTFGQSSHCFVVSSLRVEQRSPQWRCVGDGDTANLPQTPICYPVDRRTSYIINGLRVFVKRKLSPAVHRAAHRRENLVHLHGLEPGTH